MEIHKRLDLLLGEILLPPKTPSKTTGSLEHLTAETTIEDLEDEQRLLDILMTDKSLHEILISDGYVTPVEGDVNNYRVTTKGVLFYVTHNGNGYQKQYTNEQRNNFFKAIGNWVLVFGAAATIVIASIEFLKYNNSKPSYSPAYHCHCHANHY